jgi:hypothetical protein
MLDKSNAIERAFNVFRPETDADVPHIDQDCRPTLQVVALTIDCDDTMRFWCRYHGFAGVHHEIEQHLLELDSISCDSRQILERFDSNCGSALGPFPLNERHDVRHHVFDL